MISKSRTTYKPSVHPNFAKLRNPKKEQVQGLTISIEVMPPVNVAELRALYEEALNEEAIRQPLPLYANSDEGRDQSDEGRDQTAWKNALITEINRCDKPEWMKRKLEHPAHPTQHARIDRVQLKQLEGILQPETLRRKFISIRSLMLQIQKDISEYLKYE